MGLLSRILDPIFGEDDRQVTSTTSLPPWLSEYGQWYTGQMRQFGENAQFPGMADFNQDQLSAFQGFRDQANSPMLRGAEDLATRTMRGDFLNSNPYLDNMVRQTTDDLQGRFNTTALGSGSFGNANATQQGMQGIANAANNLRFQGYESERGRQMQAMGFAPQLSQARSDVNRGLLGVGGFQQDYANQRAMAPFEFQRQNLALMGSPLGYNMGTQTSQNLPGNSGLQNWLGLLSAGAGLARGSMGGR